MIFKLSVIAGISIGIVDGYFTITYFNAPAAYYLFIAMGLLTVSLWQGLEFKGIRAVSGIFTSLGLSNGFWSLSWMATTLLNPSIMETIIHNNSIGLGLGAFEPFSTYLLTTAAQMALGIGGYYYTVVIK